MKQCKITVMRQTVYSDLSEMYENKLDEPCNMRVGQMFFTDGTQPKGFCDSAWATLLPFVKELLDGGGNFYDGWMKNSRSAMISCNDGFRPVSFYLETTDECGSELYSDLPWTDNTVIEYCKQCEDCVYRDRSVLDAKWTFNKKPMYGFSKAICDIYPMPSCKPLFVINNKGACNFYKKEK